MKDQGYREVELTIIDHNPINPRKNFSGPKFDELVVSIREKGVIQPITLRPKDKGRYEIVFGERRFRALSLVATAALDPEKFKIPAIIRELTDDEAFEMMTIENLQREDLTELEEAHSFQDYLARKGDDALPELAERTGINEKYIRRRVKILSLPKKVLGAWDKGTLKYGHLEQLCRLAEKKDVLEYYDEIISWGIGHMSVKMLKDRIDGHSIELKKAKFDIAKTGCNTCFQNSDVQKIMFGDIADLGKTQCLNPKCFKQNQNNWLQANWEKAGYHKRYGTNGFRFQNDLKWDQYETFYGGRHVDNACKKCPDFITMLNIDGSVYDDKACIGDKSCFNKLIRQKEDKEKAGQKEKSKAWHGEYFRERFYNEQIPLKLKETLPADGQVKKLLLASLVYSNDALREWLFKNYSDKKPDLYRISVEKIWEIIEPMADDKVEEVLKQASICVVIQPGFGARARHSIGTYIGLDLAREWRITEEYLDKKTIKEILAIGEGFDIFQDKKAKDFLYEVLNKKRGKFKNCKKSELIRMLIESGVDLAGKVPDEILNIK